MTNLKLFNELKDPEKLEKALEQANSNVPVEVNTRVYTPKKIDTRLSFYEEETKIRQIALKNAIPFIHPAFNEFFKLTRGLILLLAESGHSKSTTLACIVAEFLRTQGNGDGIVISNEETSESVYNRIACVLLGLNHKKFHEERMSRKDVDQVRDMVSHIVRRIEVVNDPAWDMNCLEDVQAVLEYGAKTGIRIALIDYLQTITVSRDRPQLEPVQISKLLGTYLKEYGKRVGIPVGVFAQLKPKSESPDVSLRVQNDRTIYNHAFDVLEIIPDFAARTTRFVCHKNRFGDSQGKEITMRFVEGRYEPLDEI